ncbi:MAG: biopolymer transporter Tol [Lysobacteraceae bacterium]|nr:MAG: biopolymer transporter Tol [Xanthomonadaceae bacterium]
MLNPRSHPLYQETDWLKVGDFIVDLPRREVSGRAQHEPSRLTVKALHVLLALAGQQGKVVSREALLEWVWPDTMPTDDVLTQAVGQLRKAFADDRDAPRYLETISKGGYRLVAPIEWLQDHGTDNDATAVPAEADVIQAPPPVVPAPPRRRVPAMATAVAALAVVVAGASTWYFTHRQSPAAPAATVPAAAIATADSLPFVTITSRPGRETSANLSPDGAMVAYVQVDDKGIGTIMLQSAAHVPARPLTVPPAGHSDVLPVWSPDGRTLAFARFQDSRCSLMLIAASGGNERKIADCFAGAVSSYDWTPDGSGLLMGLETRASPGERASPLRLLDIASGQWRTLQYPIADGDIDIDPRYSPDGRWIVFRRNISLSDLWKMPAGGGAPVRLTRIKSDIRGWDWLPDGSGLIFSYIGNKMGMYHYDMASGAINKLDMQDTGIFPDIARHSPSMVFIVDQSTSGVFRFDLPGAGGQVRKQRLFSSSRSDMLPAISPDGRQLAFISDRGSRLELWIGEVDKPDSARPVDTIMPVPRHMPVWSEDGSRLLVVGNQSGQQALYDVEVESGRVHELPVPAPSPIYAAYTGEANQLIVGSDSGEGRLRAVLYDRSQSPWRELATLQDVALVRFDARNDRIYFTRVTKPGTWSASTGLQDVQVVDAARPRLAREYKRWDIGADGVYFLDWSERCATGWSKMGTPSSQSPLCLDKEVEAWPLSPSADRTGKAVFLTLDVSNNADVGLADLSVITSGTGLAKRD